MKCKWTVSSYRFEAASDARLEVEIVIPVRHPNEVTASLIARDRISMELASIRVIGV